MTNKRKTAIVLIDIQGKLAEIMHESEQLFNNLEKLIKGAKLLNIPIIWTEQLPEKLSTTTENLKSLLHDNKPIIKSEFSCVLNTEFAQYIKTKKFNHFLVCGIETHVCVYQTVKDLLEIGHDVELIADAVSSRTKLNKEIGIDKMLLLGAQVTSVEMLLLEEQVIAKGDEFRELIKIIK